MGSIPVARSNLLSGKFESDDFLIFRADEMSHPQTCLEAETKRSAGRTEPACLA